jgi:hypothetical protein
LARLGFTNRPDLHAARVHAPCDQVVLHLLGALEAELLVVAGGVDGETVLDSCSRTLRPCAPHAR